jgi:hypothetical protein
MLGGCSLPAAELELSEQHLEEQLQGLTRRLCGACGSRLISLVAVGSIGRAYVARMPVSHVRPDDYDLIAIVDESRIIALELKRRMNRCLERAGSNGDGPISLGVLRRRDLPKLPFTLFNYELRYGCRVLHGEDPSEDMPPYDSERVPLIEATRLLLNRGVLLWGDALRVRESAPSPDDALSIAVRNQKAIMSIGDALLIAGGRFHGSYRRRIEGAHACGLFDHVDSPDLRKKYIRAMSEKLGDEVPKFDPDMLRSETLLIFNLHEQVLRHLERLRLGKRFADWSVYAAWDLKYPQYLRGEWLERAADLLLTFGAPRGNGFYRRHRGRCVEEVLLRAFPYLAYGRPGVEFLREALNWQGETKPDEVTVWRHFRQIWRGGR